MIELKTVKQVCTLTGLNRKQLFDYADVVIRNVLNGYEGNDYLFGSNLKDTLNGGEGHDSLYGSGGDDILNGGNGKDSLNGGTGTDWLNGGLGNDWLNGSDGDDYYVFEKGHGQDEVFEVLGTHYGDSGVDTIVMADYTKQDLWFSRDVFDNLLINGIEGDQVKVVSQFSIVERQMEFFTFANGEKLNATAVNHLVNSMAAFASKQTTNLSTSELRELYWANYATV